MFSKPTKFNQDEDYRSVMTGLRELDLRGTSIPCNLVLTGEHAFPLLINSKGQVLMAASSYDNGRIVVVSHETYLFTFPALVEKALIWLTRGKSGNPSVGVHKALQEVANKLNGSTFQVSIVGGFSESPGVSAYVTDAYSVGAPQELVAFLKSGGGVLIGGQAWNWAAHNPKANTFLQFPGNKVSGVAGIYFTSEYGEKDILPIYPEIPSSWRSINVGKNLQDDLDFLVKGISGFELGGGFHASEALVHGPLAFPIGITEDERVFLAGTYYGLGRVILATQEGFFKADEFPTLQPFWKNAINWLDQGRKGVIGFDPEIKILTDLDLKCQTTTFRPDLSVYVCTAYSDKYVEEIQNFVAEGGGLMIGGHAWWWASQNPEKNPFRDFAGNKIVNKMGLTLLTQGFGKGSYKYPKPNQGTEFHFRRLLHRFADHLIDGKNLTKEEEEHLLKMGQKCSDFLSMEAYDSFSYTQVLLFLTDILKKFGIPQAGEQNPLKTPADQFLLGVSTAVFNACPNQDALLPYLIKNIPSLPVMYNKRISVNAKTAENEEWIKTDLYLSPGMKAYMIMPSKLVNSKWKIQIGCKADECRNEVLKKAPSVIKQYQVTSEVMQVVNLWGGHLFLVAPKKVQVDGEEVIVQVAASSPF